MIGCVAESKVYMWPSVIYCTKGKFLLLYVKKKCVSKKQMVSLGYRAICIKMFLTQHVVQTNQFLVTFSFQIRFNKFSRLIVCYGHY